ncbi:uncharacterized protein LOC106663041 isoform X2 [Cimex lectularius]|nr:uncharacterized protein LOC106663041 isoform X2 [Cimex lectularius]XP_014243055.1 uncharacterized protein LOC106663041 isoform X2 [Cimex lectularius]XP_014243063.1 uncharacterized protein LOC106663041 isoform X2 [Cimex lectularius]
MELLRRNSIPVLHVKGTYYDVGYDIGRTFASLIQTYLEINSTLNKIYIPAYNTERGRKIYEETLFVVGNKYPHYLRELEGTADGAGVPFYKLFLLHLDDIILPPEGCTNVGQGCSTVIVNQKNQKIIGHTEDGLKEALNLCYVVNVHITESSPHEIFTAFCYPGLLPGYSMGFNSYFAFTINIMVVKNPPAGRIPRTFLTRELFAADSVVRAEEVLKCYGGGVADAFSVNLMTLKNNVDDCLLYNFEVSPKNLPSNSSIVEKKKIDIGEHFFHCNKFLRIKGIEEISNVLKTSNDRHETEKQLPKAEDLNSVINILSHSSAPSTCCNIFRDRSSESVITLATAIFNRATRTWSIYMDNPALTEPNLILPMKFS